MSQFDYENNIKNKEFLPPHSLMSKASEQVERPIRKVKKYEIEFKKFYIPFTLIFIPCFLYAFFRYTINHNEPWYDLPFYLSNKVFAVSSTIMMCLAYVIGPLAKINSRFKKYIGHRKYFGIGGFLAGASHGLMSFVLMTPENYKTFYNLETGRLNLEGSLSMLFGTLSLMHLFFIAVISLPPIMREMNAKQWKYLQKTGIFAMAVVFLHIASFGYVSWFNLKKWYGGMPPFSLVGASSIVVIFALRYYLIARGKKLGPTHKSVSLQ